MSQGYSPQVERAVIRAGLQRGFFDQTKLDQARAMQAQLGPSAPSLLVLLASSLGPRERAALSQVFQQASRSGGDPAAGAPAAAEGDEEETIGPGSRVGDFLLDAELGRGAMGRVYLAQSPRHPQPVALKLLLEGADERTASRFRREARAVARLRHEHIVPVIEHNKTPQGVHYMALEYVEGGSLQQQIEREGPADPRQAAAMARDLALALDFAHEVDVLHRDVKPANVLIDARGRARLTDFGLAKVLGDDLQSRVLTAAGDVLGSPSYMAPEQARGEVGRIGPTSDVYGLGATLYQTLTGRVPFQAKSLTQLLFQIVREPPRRPTTIRPEVPADLEAIVLRCLEKDPAQRYQSGAELAQALDDFLAGRKLRGEGGASRGKLVALGLGALIATAALAAALAAALR